MALIRRILSRLSGSEVRGLMAQIEGEAGAARLGLSGRAAPVWARLVRLAWGLPGPWILVALGLLVTPALIAPEWYAARLVLLDHLPEAIWWLVGAGLSLAFGVRFQRSEQDFTRELIDRTILPAPLATAATGSDAALALAAEAPADNAPLAEWMALRGRT